MFKEMNGKMELHVSHELSIRANVEREYAVKDYSVTFPKAGHFSHHTQ
jgi:hypothetical protein